MDYENGFEKPVGRDLGIGGCVARMRRPQSDCDACFGTIRK
jgi:hypothetical protein